MAFVHFQNCPSGNVVPEGASRSILSCAYCSGKKEGDRAFMNCEWKVGFGSSFLAPLMLGKSTARFFTLRGHQYFCEECEKSCSNILFYSALDNGKLQEKKGKRATLLLAMT
uniref:Uncharacterized protein n=1 Tax=Populus davidiana TaxID=266767 RepID=A0A6M2ELQ8_9ROSI